MKMNMEMIMSVGHQKYISKFFPKRAILYQPGLANVLGSVNAAIILSQLLYWHTRGKRPDGFVFKTSEEMQNETGLSRSEQDHALKILLDLNIIEKKLAQIPAKRHFRVNFVVLQKLLPRLKEKSKLAYPNPPGYVDDNLQRITDSTQETTTKITNKDNYSQAKAQLSQGMSIKPP